MKPVMKICYRCDYCIVAPNENLADIFMTLHLQGSHGGIESENDGIITKRIDEEKYIFWKDLVDAGARLPIKVY